jgi:phosphoribosylamine-glycine ligase
VKQAYEAVARIRFDGMQYRRDIAARALAPSGTGQARSKKKT